MNVYVELWRPADGILAVLGIILGAIVAHAFAVPNVVDIFLAMAVAFLINGAGNTINDYFDYKIDKINRPQKPIPSGRVKRNSVLYYFITLIIVSLVLAYFVSTYFFYLVVINSIISYVYSLKLKGTPLIGNLTVSWLAASTFLGGALILYTFYSIPPSVVILAAIAFLGTLSREIFKDIEDVKGDREGGAKTLPILIGEIKSRIIAAVVLIFAILSLILPAYFKFFSNFYYIGMVPAVLISLVAIAKMKNAHKSQKMIKIAMYFVFLGFILGSVI